MSAHYAAFGRWKQLLHLLGPDDGVIVIGAGKAKAIRSSAQQALLGRLLANQLGEYPAGCPENQRIYLVRKPKQPHRATVEGWLATMKAKAS